MAALVTMAPFSSFTLCALGSLSSFLKCLVLVVAGPFRIAFTLGRRLNEKIVRAAAARSGTTRMVLAKHVIPCEEAQVKPAFHIRCTCIRVRVLPRVAHMEPEVSPRVHSAAWFS